MSTYTGTKAWIRPCTAIVAALAVVIGMLMPVAAASAAAGSRVAGVAWADTDRDGVRDTGEPLRSGVTVQLLSSPDGTVVATTTTNATGVYSFADVADGDYVVRVDAPGAFVFPASASGDNDFSRTGAPAPGEPERGATPPLSIAGATQVVNDAGLQPIANLQVAKITQTDACEGFARTGTPPFDATDDPGQDTGTANCTVRTNDTVTQNYSVALTGLPTGASVPNVIAEFTISSPDGADLELVGPGTNGIPAGCLAAANGANPPSSRTINADGSITVRCNLGTMSSNAAAIQIAYKFSTATPIPSHAEVEMRAYAGAGDAGPSNTVDGPLVAVTGTAQWDLAKSNYVGRHFSRSAGPDFTVQTIDGVQAEGYRIRYAFDMEDMLGGTGGADLVWPVTFTDRLSGFPTARIIRCRATDVFDGANVNSPWTMTCPSSSEPQGTDGWDISVAPNSGVGGDTGEGHMVMDIFIPLEDMNRAIDPAWQPGDPAPTGTFELSNAACDTDTWHINGGALNYGDGHEPGWDCTDNNLATRNVVAQEAQWDLSKSFRGGPSYGTETINGQRVDGYYVDYNLQIKDLVGPDNVAPWLDRPVTFKDRMIDPAGAILLRCTPLNIQNGTTNGTPTCETGAQPADGWDMSWMPNDLGFDTRQGNFIASVFIPMDAIPADPCEQNVFLDLENQAVDSDHWTVEGNPVNGTGFEPGWDGTEATGNNLVESHIRPADSQCGTLSGNKGYDATQAFPGRRMNSVVSSSGSNNRVSVTNLRLCDVFDVSTQMISPAASNTAPATINQSGTADRTQYVIEYAIGPNQVDTQSGAPVNGVYPVDSSSNQTAVADCPDAAGPWVTDPSTLGADWRDRVNMVRMRPLDATRTEVGAFGFSLVIPLEVRGTYNGGPNAGEDIPAGIRMTNEGGWPSGHVGDDWGTQWSTVERQIVTSGPGLQVAKSVTPTQYLPGDTVRWNLSLLGTRAAVGMTMRDVRVVDTIPAQLEFDAACTQGLLPPGTTVSYNAATREATFSAGDFPFTSVDGNGNQWIFHPTIATARGPLQICTKVSTLAQPGDTYINRVAASSPTTTDRPTSQATIQIVGSGQLGIEKRVDKPYVASGEMYNWTLDWGNTSTQIAFANPDVIDVLPWNGDGASGALSKRDQYSSSYQGLAQLTGPLPQPTYAVGGGGGDVAGAWYYTTAGPATINHDSRAAVNANPAAAGGLWLTAAEVSDFASVTGIRFVSATALPTQSRVRAVVPAVSTSTALDNVYVNRATIASATFPDQLLLSNEPFVQMPGFTIGDLFWLDQNGDGKFTDGVDTPVGGVEVEVLNDAGDVVGTATTRADGRWSVAALPEGTYRARIPAAMFQTGGPLERYGVSTTGSRASDDENEDVSNDNTATPDPKSTGLVSTPITLAYVYDNSGNLTGANGPVDDDVASLAAPLIGPEFTNFTIDLAVAPQPGVDIEKATNGQDADEPTGPLVTVGGAVRWTYVVTNTGSTDLFDLTVTDDMVDSSLIDCDGTGGNVIAGPIAPDASFECVATGVATIGQYANMGTVFGRGPDGVDGNGNDVPGVEVTDEDPSHYFGIEPKVDIEKETNGDDADEGTGPLVPVGGDVRWTYVVKNTGNADLFDITVTDDKVDSSLIDCDGTGRNVVAGPLAPGDWYECFAKGAATAGQYENMGTVTARGPVTTDVDGNDVPGDEVTDKDPSHYYGEPPAVRIGGLAFTGGQLGIGAVIAAMILFSAGLTLLVMRRRRRDTPNAD